jgi:hypothetical protein
VRTATAAQEQGLEALHRVTRVWVDVWDADTETWATDLTELAGEQWLKAVEIRGDDESTTVPRATLRLHRETHETSLAPLVQDPPLLVAGALLRIRVAVWEQGQDPTDPVLMMEGRIEENAWGGNASEITLDIREALMARLHHTWILDEFTVGPGNIQELVQEILDEWTPGITVVMGDNGDPDAFVFPEAGVLREQSVEDAIRSIVAQAGWDIRRLEVGGEFELVLFEPRDPSQGDPPDPVLTYDPVDYYEIPQMGFSSIGMRDQVIVLGRFGETETRVTVQADEPLIGDEYRGFKLDERDNQFMASEQQLIDFGQRALLVTARLPVATEVELPFDWRPELADWLRFSPNNVHHAEDFDGAVTAARHVIEPGVSSGGGGTTTLSIRGSFGGHLESWRQRIRRTRLKGEIEDALPDDDPLPPILPPDAALYYTQPEAEQGFADPSEQAESLGGYVSTTRVTDFGSGDVFRAVNDDELGSGATLYRALAFINAHASLRTPSLRAYVPDAGEDEDVAFAIGLDPAGVVDLEDEDPQGATIADEETAPAGVSFSAPDNVNDGLVIGEMPPRTAVLIWVRLTITATPTAPETGGQLCIEVCMPSDPEPE